MKQPNKLMFPQAQTNDRSVESEWVPVVLREVKNTDEKYGKSTMEVRFNLYGALQHSGLDVGQFIGLRGEFDGETLMGCKCCFKLISIKLDMVEKCKQAPYLLNRDRF